MESKTSTNNYKSVIQNITSSILKNEIIDISNFEEELDDDIKLLIDAYNNSRFSENHEQKYSELKSEYEKLKQEVEMLKKLNEEIQKNNQEKDYKLEQLSNENTEYKEKETKILELLKH